MDPSKKSETENGTTYTTSTPVESKHNIITKPYLKSHNRSSSLENNNIHLLPSTKSSLMPQTVLPGFSGTLKSRREQKRISDYLSKAQNQESSVRKLNFENIREIFEKNDTRLNTEKISIPEKDINQNVPIRDTDVENVLPHIDNNQRNDIPPRITATLSQRKNVIRPIAFKPVPYNNNTNVNNNRKNSLSNPNGRTKNNWIERYGSTPSLAPLTGNYHRFGSTTELNQQLAYNSLPRKSGTNMAFKTYDSLESILKLPDSITPTQYMSKSSHAAYQEIMNDQIIAPSPSDSNISELEVALRERESELAHLRRTMEHNEKVIFKVHQDKERHWELELTRLKAIHENRLKAGAQKVHKLEQLLMMQTFALRQDKKRLIEQAEFMKQQIERQRKEINSMKTTESNLKDQNNDLSEEIQMLRRVVSELKEKLEEVEWSLYQKNGESTLLKTELEDVQNEVTLKNKQILDLKCIISKTRSNNLEDTSDSNSELSQMTRIILFKDQLIEALNNEIQKLQKDLADLSILSDYEGIPAGHYLRHKYDSLNSSGTNSSPCTTSSPTSEKFSGMMDEPASMNKPTKETMLINNTSSNNNDMKRVFLYSQISSNQITIENIKNLPDITVTDDSIYVNSSEDDFKSLSSSQEIISQDSTSLNGQILENSNKVTEDYQKLTIELQKCKESYEADKLKWAQEKEKVLIYQRQLQKKYLEVLGKTEELGEKLNKVLNKSQDSRPSE